MKAKEMKILIPTIGEVEKSSEAGANLETLCANWRKGCNGVTDGPEEGQYLALCDDCENSKPS